MSLEEKLKIGARVKEEWEELVNAMQKIKKDKNYNSTLKVPLTNIKADARTIYLCLNAFSSLALGQNQNLLTLVHDGKNVLKAYAELAEDGVYTSIKKIELDGWEKYVDLNLITKNPWTPLYIQQVAKNKTGISPKIVKVAHIDFFSEFQPYKTESKLEFIARAYPACVAVYDKNLISFYPEPPIFKILGQLIKEANIRPIGEKLENYTKKIIAQIPDYKFGLAIQTLKGIIGLKIYKDKNDIQLYMQSEFTNEELSLKKISRIYKSKLNVESVIAFDSSELTTYLSSLMKYDVPWSEEAYKTFFSESKKFLLKYNKFFNNARGIGIKTTYNLLKLLFLFN